MRISRGVLAVGLTAVLSLASAGPVPAMAGEVVVIVSAPHHSKVRVIVGDAVPRHGLKAHPGVKVIGPKHPHSVFAPAPRVHRYSHRAHRAGGSPLDKRFRSTRPHPVIASLRPSHSGLRASDLGLRASDIGLRPSSLSSRPAPSLRGKPLHAKPVHAKPVHIKIGTQPRHALQGLPAGSRFVLQDR
jgi:hypothetical protein